MPVRGSEIQQLRGANPKRLSEFAKRVYLRRRRVFQTLKSLNMTIGKIGPLSKRLLCPACLLAELPKVLCKLKAYLFAHERIVGLHDLLHHDL